MIHCFMPLATSNAPTFLGELHDSEGAPQARPGGTERGRGPAASDAIGGAGGAKPPGQK